MTNLTEALKPLIADLASTLLFALLIAVTGNVYLATGLGIALGLAQLLVQTMRRKPVAAMQWLSLVLVLVFGTLTLYFHDPRFVKIKFTIAYVAVGAVMIKPNWMSRYLPKIVTETLSVSELTFYSAMWPVMMFALAIANLYVGFEMSQKAWAWFLATVPAAAPLTLFGLQYLVIRLHVRRILRSRLTLATA